MSLPWFRMYAEFAKDPKVQSMDETLQRRLVMMFCLKCSEELSLSHDELACALRISSEELETTLEVFRRKGFMDADDNLCNWEKRQFASDTSASRTRRYREKRAAAGLPKGSAYLVHWAAVYERDDGKCVYCGTTEKLCLDHMIPVPRGGTDHEDNLALSCKRCNSGKAGRTPTECGYEIKGAAAREALDRFLRNTTCDRHSDGSVTSPDTDTDSDTEPSLRSGARKRARATRLPKDFELTDERRLVAEAETLPADRTFAKFRDYWMAASGAKARKHDWDATWRNWCRSEADRSRGNSRPQKLSYAEQLQVDMKSKGMM